MYKCPNCDFKTSDAVNYCPQCGSKTVFEEPVNVSAPVEQITYAESVDTVIVEPAPVKRVHLAKKIVGMALSAGAFIFAIIATLYTTIFSVVDGTTGFILGIVYAIMGLPPAIVGLTMSKNNANNGDTSVFSRLGKIFGIISIVLLGIGFIVGLLSVGAGHSLFGYDYH